MDGEILNWHAGMSPQVSAFYLIGHGIGGLVPMSHGAMWAGFGFRFATVMLGYMEVVYYMRHGGRWDGCVWSARGFHVSVSI